MARYGIGDQATRRLANVEQDMHAGEVVHRIAQGGHLNGQERRQGDCDHG
jgi:hypothetical protein